ncbi:MAG: hypothetical protein MPJ50_09540 [Pirellulales bacterium]|nr:hypothetical protein [Pirellulales bacterium]
MPVKVTPLTANPVRQTIGMHFQRKTGDATRCATPPVLVPRATGAVETAPGLSPKLHREALVEAIDPETATTS